MTQNAAQTFKTRYCSWLAAGLTEPPERGYARLKWHSWHEAGHDRVAPVAVTGSPEDFQWLTEQLSMSEPASWYPLIATPAMTKQGPSIWLRKDMAANEGEYELLDYGLGIPGTEVSLRLYDDDAETLQDIGFDLLFSGTNKEPKLMGTFDVTLEKTLDYGVGMLVAGSYDAAHDAFIAVANSAEYSAIAARWAWWCLDQILVDDVMGNYLSLTSAASEESSVVYPGFDATRLRLRKIEYPEISAQIINSDGYFTGPEKYFQDQLSRNPQDEIALIGLGYILSRSQRDEEGIAKYSEAIALNPNSHRAYALRGDRYRRIGELDLAYADLRKAISIEQYFATHHMQFGVLLDRMGQSYKAIQHLGVAIRIDMRFSEAHIERAYVWNGMGQYPLEVYDFHCVHRIKSDAYGYIIPNSTWQEFCRSLETKSLFKDFPDPRRFHC